MELRKMARALESSNAESGRSREVRFSIAPVAPRETARRPSRKRAGASSVTEAVMSEDASRALAPTLDDIRERAYFIYLNRCANGVSGDPSTDWFQAMAELAQDSARAG